MKQTLHISLFLALLLLCAGGPGRAATISGTIYTTGGVYGATPVPAPGAAVWIYPYPSGMSYISTTTNSVGNYSITIPAAWPTSGYIDVRDSAASGGCKGPHGQLPYTGSSLIFNDTLCNYLWYTIGGHVSLQGGGAAVGARVWFIDEYPDTSGAGTATMLKAYDSTTTDASGDYLFAKRGYSITGTQRIKAALQPGHPNYSAYLPTYHDSSLIWSSATMFGPSAWTGQVRNLNVSLRGGVNPGGLGFIAGDVLLGANKSTSVSDPLPSRIVLLTTAAGKGVAYAYSDASGHFSFANLAYGTYLLSGDAWGKSNPMLRITLSAGMPAVTDVVFEENSTAFKGGAASLGIAPPAGLAAITVYPSPMEGHVALSGLGAVPGEKTAVLRDITGAVVRTTKIAAGIAITRIQTEALAGGRYILELQTSAGTTQYPLIKK